MEQNPYLHGLQQFKGTCYFNSVFNAFLLGTIGRKLLYNAYLKYKLYIVRNAKQQQFFDCIDTLMTQPDFCIQSINPSVLRMYFFAFISIFMCHRVNKKVSATNVDNLMVSIKEQRIPSFGSQLSKGGYSFETLRNLLDTMELPQPMIITKVLGEPTINLNKLHPLLVISELESDIQEVPNTLFVDVNNVKHTYLLDHAVINIFTSASSGHAAICSITNKQPIIYDSNQNDVLLCDWTKINMSMQNLKDYFAYLKTIERFEFLYICYVAEQYVNSLEDIPVECEWSGNFNNTAYMIHEKLHIHDLQVCHVIVYDNKFLQNILFQHECSHTCTTMRFQNTFFYKNVNDRIPLDLEHNITENNDNEIVVHVICTHDCYPTKKRLGAWRGMKNNKIRTFIELLKTSLRKFRRRTKIIVNQITFSAVELGYVSDVTQTYHKSL